MLSDFELFEPFFVRVSISRQYFNLSSGVWRSGKCATFAIICTIVCIFHYTINMFLACSHGAWLLSVRSCQSASIGPRGNSIHLPLVGGNSQRRNVVPQPGTELAYYCLHNVYVTSHTYTLHQQSRYTCVGTDRQNELRDSHLADLYPNNTWYSILL